MSDQPDETLIKPLRPLDLDAVIAIDKVSSGNSRCGYFEKRLEAAIELPQDYVFVGLFVDKKLAGFAFAKLTTGAFGQSEAAASLDAIGVHPDFGLQGYGHKLLKEVETILRHKGVVVLTSQIDWDSQQMLNFMAREGFALASRIVLSCTTDEIELELVEEDDDDELDFSSPDGDAENALSRDRIPVRTMIEGDLAKIISIDAANIGWERRDYYVRKQQENLFQSGVQVSLVAEQDGFPVGFIMARVDYGEFGRASMEAVMDTIAVDPNFKGQSIGKTLMAKLMAHLANLQVDTVRTEVTWNETRLIDFFGAIGFEPAQRVALTKTL